MYSYEEDADAACERRDTQRPFLLPSAYPRGEHGPWPTGNCANMFDLYQTLAGSHES